MGSAAQDLILNDDSTQKLVDILHSQHALMGIYGDVFQELGGRAFLLEWAADNPSKFLSMLVKMVPNIAPSQGLQGDVVIRISADLPRSKLDD
jgi:hypothetical protein